MIKKFTLNHLLQYHYQELKLIDKIGIEQQLECDENFRNESNKIAAMKRLLDIESNKPSSSSINIILNHNRKSRGELEMR
jgi:hypothetical protein